MPYEIKVEKVIKSRLAETDLENIVFGRIFSDHMLVSDYEDGDWRDTKIVPYGNISLSPATTALHYGQEIFEGLKAYRDANGDAYIFRPYENFKRMNISAERMAMPHIPEDIFMNGLKELVKLDKGWIPGKPGSAMYIRPFMFSNDEYVGIKVSDNYKFIIFCSPVNSYYPEPIKVKIEQVYTRASGGGTGEAKAAGNYAASLYPQKLAMQKGYRQLLWTDAKEHKYIEESGTMNVFFNIDGTIITPSFSGSILKGITRDSCLTLLRDQGYKVEERPISVDEIVDAYRKGTLREAFGTGTAATIALIEAIGYNDEELTLPPVTQSEVALWLNDTLDKIKRCELPDKYNWMLKV